MSKIMNQDEVDALLRGISGGEIETEEEVVETSDDIVAFDLVNQDRIIRGRMPVLEIINDRFPASRPVRWVIPCANASI